MKKLFIELLPNFIHVANRNKNTSKFDFIKKVKEVYSLENIKTKTFVEAAEKTEWLSISHFKNEYTLNY